MTYCLAIKIDAGLVFASDSRTNAGPDQVSTYSKMRSWGAVGDRQIVMLSAGNLATTQAVVTRIQRDIDEQVEGNLFSLRYMTEVAEYLGKLNVRQQTKHTKHTDEGMTAGFSPEATFIVGGQVSGEAPDLYMVYPQGNYINVSDTSPFLQIGEAKYGKPILDRIIHHDTSIDDAVKCALVSMDSTIRSNVTVGPPIEIVTYLTDSLAMGKYWKLEAEDPYLLDLKNAWDEKLRQAFSEMPRLE